ncbi:hypothetical protein DESC_200006 [Desulfosarcina cetonica]|nr:hypothetical protein DESC_200006 [Desulfosarcina cetonica]
MTHINYFDNVELYCQRTLTN